MSNEAVDGPERTATTESPQGRWDSARDKFMSLRTGDTDGDPNMQLLAAALVHVPATIEAVNNLGGAWEKGSLEHWARNTPVAKYAFDYAGLALNVAVDGLTGIYAEVVLAQALPAYSLLTLARQVSESALRAGWILGDLTPDGLVTRGFAAAWQEAETQRTFTNHAINFGMIASDQVPIARQRVSDRRAELVVEGRAHRLLNRPKKPRDLGPAMPVPTMSSLFEHVNGPVGPNGNQDMRWLYSLLSGVAHGRAWAAISATVPTLLKEYLNYTDDGRVVSSGTVLAKADPSSMNVVLAVQVGIINTLEALGRFNEARALPAPLTG